MWHQPNFALIYLESIYFYVSYFYALWLMLSWDCLLMLLSVTTPMGDSLVDRVYRSCLMTVQEFNTRADRIV